MIIVEINGGLGNQMFQYALGRCLSLKNNTELKLDINIFNNHKLRKYELGFLNIIENIATEEEIEKIKYIKSKMPGILRKPFKIPKYSFNADSHIHEKHFHFDPEILNLPNDLYVEGYWQSEKYFKQISDIIKKDFTVKNELSGKNKEFAEEISKGNSVSLHIRRGDYVNDAKTKAAYYVDLDEYYKNAINLINEKVNCPHFYIFSDEPEWVKNNYAKDLNCSVVDINSADNGYEDMRLMSLCKHNIIANSSFSWWGAWLNNNTEKIVVSPKKWFNHSDFDTKDLQPESRIQL